MSIAEIADAFEHAPREGTEKDAPKDTSAVPIDTAMDRLERELRLAAGDRPDAETFEERES